LIYPLGGSLHVQGDVVEQVGEVKDQLVLLLVTLRPDFDEGAEQQAMDEFERALVGRAHVKRFGCVYSTLSCFSSKNQRFAPINRHDFLHQWKRSRNLDRCWGE
jgi:hypothetical protein